MKVAFIFAVVFLSIVAGAIWFRSRDSNRDPTAPSGQQSSNPMLELRNRILSWPASDIGLSDPSPPPAAWAVVMELGYEDFAASLVSLEDGNASLYFSNGGGIIGGYAHDGARNAAQAFVQAASSCAEQFHQTQEFPLPTDGQVFFYLRQGSLTLATSASESAIQQEEHPLYGLYVAGQNVITELRLIQQEEGDSA